MISEETVDLIKAVFSHPKDALYDVFRILHEYRMVGRTADGRMLRNLVLSLPESDAVKYRDEIEFLKSCDQDYLADNVFPYPMREKGGLPVCGFDAEKALPYVVHKGMRLYFCHGVRETEAQKTYLDFIEKEGLLGGGCLVKSPHSYVADSFCVEDGDVLVDVGCAEALFTLDNIRKVSRAYAFETMKKWAKPLMATFSPFRDKVRIVNKFVGGRTDGRVVRLADALDDQPDARYFLKMDIEGGEYDVLRVSSDFLQSHKVKLACCLYHRQEDEKRIVKLLDDIGFEVKLSEGYMLPTMGGIAYPYFRRGVAYARNF